MKLNPIVLFAAAGALGLVAFLATQQYLAGNKDATVPVLVAAAEIRVGDPITEENAKFKELPVSALPPKPITEKAQYEGMFAGSVFLPGDVMVQGKVGRDYGAISRAVPPGKQTVAISVDKTQSQAGNVRPGDRVDVWVTHEIDDVDPLTGSRDSYTQTQLVLGDLQVWAVGREVVGRDQSGSDRAEKKDTARGGRGDGTISLVVEKSQIAKLSTAQKIGSLSLSLRHPDDDSDTGDVVFDSRDLFEGRRSQEKREEPPAPAPEPVVAEVDEDDLKEDADDADDRDQLDAFLAAEAAPKAPAKPAEPTAEDVPTWISVMHVGGEARMVEVVDVTAALEAGFTPAQIAQKRMFLADPGSVPTPPARVARVEDGLQGLAAPPGYDPAARKRRPAGPPDGATAVDSALAAPTTDADGGDGLYPLPGN